MSTCQIILSQVASIQAPRSPPYREDISSQSHQCGEGGFWKLDISFLLNEFDYPPGRGALVMDGGQAGRWEEALVGASSLGRGQLLAGRPGASATLGSWQPCLKPSTAASSQQRFPRSGH